MEQSLGLTLFSRHQNGYRLTDEGRTLLSRAEALEDAAQALSLVTPNEISGTVRIATAENLANIIFIPGLEGLINQHPNLSIELVTDIATANLHQRDADLAIRMVRPERGNVSIRRIGTLGYGLYGSHSYVDNRPDGAAGRDFNKDRFISWSERQSNLPQAIWLEGLLEGRAPSIVTTTLASQVVSASAGLGLAVLPHFLAVEAGLVELAVQTEVQQPIWLVVHSDLAQSRKIRTVADHLVQIVQKHAAFLEFGAER